MSNSAKKHAHLGITNRTKRRRKNAPFVLFLTGKVGSYSLKVHTKFDTEK
jgi:hypothetical protein